MNRKALACMAFLFNAVLFGTYYAISKEVLGRIDPILFTFFEMITLAPVAVGLLIWRRREITRPLLKRGFLLGSSLCLALFTIAIGLKYTTATCTAFFPSLNGFLAAFLAWMVLRQPVAKTTWVAGVLSVVGSVLLIVNASVGGPRGSLIALLGSLFFTGYVFLSESEQKDVDAPWTLLGMELLTTALWATLIVLLFGDWSSFHPHLPKDAWVILYVAGACTFLPTLITILMQKYISPLTISFLYIVEPVFGAILAFLYLHEVLPPGGYLGGGLVVVGAIIHIWGSGEVSGQSRFFAPSRTRRPAFLSIQVMCVRIGEVFMVPVWTLLGLRWARSGVALKPPAFQQAQARLLVMSGGVLSHEGLSRLGDVSYAWAQAHTDEAMLRQERTMMFNHVAPSDELDSIEPSTSTGYRQTIGVLDGRQSSNQEPSTEERVPIKDSTDGASHHSAPLLSETLIPSLPRRSTRRRVGLLATMVALLVVTGAVLLPALFSAQPHFLETRNPAAAVTTVGQVAFTSSGQLDPSSSQGLNDMITMNVQRLPTTPVGQSYYAWLMPDPTDETTRPLLLGTLPMGSRQAQLSYTHPNHEDLLALYSGAEVTQQPSNPVPTTPAFDPKALRYVGFIPNMPTPGDERHYSLLSHLRHLLAQDPTLQDIGLQGGLDIWLYRNTEKILEWSGAARDSWAGGQQAGLIHRQMLRVLEYLDGAALVFPSGDIPPGSPLLVDPQAGRIGLLEVSPAQVLPAYLTHVDLHLQGLIHAPEHTQAQQALAIKLDNALKMDTVLLQHVRQDAVKLVKMTKAQLQSQEALFLLNDLVTHANAAYSGQFDPTIGGTINGIVWIHNELQGVATIPITTPT